MAITDRAAKALAKGETHSEKVAGRGAGVLLLVGRESSVTAYYRYTAPNGSRPWIELGALGRDISLAQARARCAEYAALKQSHPHLKEWLESERVREQDELILAARRREQEATTGAFKDLLIDYLANMKAYQQVSEPVVRNVFVNEVINAFPALVERRARDIEVGDISLVLKRISLRGALVYRNRTRAYLHSAFEFALKHEFDETRLSGKTYGLKANPVSAIPVLRHAEKAGERSLSDAELRQFFYTLDRVKNVSESMANFIRFIIHIGGQRPQQVLRAPWSAYDFAEKTLNIRDLKGKRKDTQGRAHLIPLPDEAIDILEGLRPLNGRFEWPFTTTGKTPVSIGSLKNVVKRFLDSPYAEVDGEPIPHFTTRDLRRTCKQLMTRAQIPRDLRNLLQNHGQTGVDVANYTNDPAAFLPEKKVAMALYSKALKNVLNKEF
jgi:integrase